MLQNSISPPEFYMNLALEQAKAAYAAEEVPIGAVIVERQTGIILAKAYNQTLKSCDPTGHAEILAIRAACQAKGAQRIPDCDLYVTLEPCPMCAAALSFARIGHVYFGAVDEKSGGFVSGPALVTQKALHHKPAYTSGICAEDSAALLRAFFQERR